MHENFQPKEVFCFVLTPKMENDSDTLNILASDENETLNDTEDHDDNEIPLQNMVRHGLIFCKRARVCIERNN